MIFTVNHTWLDQPPPPLAGHRMGSDQFGQRHKRPERLWRTICMKMRYKYETGKNGDSMLHCPAGQLGCMVQLEVARLECCRWFSVAPSGNNEHLFIWMFIPPLFMCNQTTPDCTDDDIIAMTKLFDWMIWIPHFHCRKTPGKVTKYGKCPPLEFRL